MTREQYTDLLRVKMTEAEALMRRRMIENLGTPLFSGCDQLTPCVVDGIDPAPAPDRSAWLAAPTEDEPNNANMADAFAYSIESFLPNKGSAIRATQRLSDNVHISEIAHWPEPRPGVFYAAPEAEIPVTDKMREAGAAVDMDGTLPISSYDLVPIIYRAMRRLEPMQSTPGLWSDESVRKLIAERDQLQVSLAGSEECNRILLKHYHKILAERNEANDRLASLAAENAMLRAYPPLTRTPDGHIHAWNPDAGRWEDRDATVAFPPNPPPQHTLSDTKVPPAPKPFPAGALKPSTTDPRRVGS